MQKPNVSYQAATKRILSYLKGTLDYEISFPAADKGKECKLVGYTKSTWCRDVEDKKSTAGYMFMLGGSLVAWSSRKEQVVTLSSCEAEYITSSLCAYQTTWMLNLVKEIIGKDQWSNYHEDRQHVSYQPRKEFDSTLELRI